MTDALQIIGENTANFAGGKHLTMRFVDLIDPKRAAPKKDTRTGDEIAADIIKKVAKKPGTSPGSKKGR